MPERAAIFVFGQAGCPACEDYVPRFKRLSAPYWRQLPIGVYDLARDGKRANELASAMGIKATPTTVVMVGNRMRSVVGAVSDQEIAQMLRAVTG
jgi:thioredoxin-like negative regulator of GroEL